MTLGRAFCALLALGATTACDLEPEAPPVLLPLFSTRPDVWPPNRYPAEVTSTTVIDADSVDVLEPIVLTDGDPMPVKTVSLGKPKVLLPRSSKGTYYPAEHPLSDRRAMVSHIREDKYGRTMETYGAYLVDFEDGVVETFDSLSPYDQYSEAGVGFAWKTIDGVKHKVLVHADGTVIPMWPEEPGAPDLIFHPIWRQAWIFGVEEHPKPSTLFDDEPRMELRSVYIHWKDITKPPPTGPKVVLPFWFQFEDRVINNETGNLHGPRPKEQADVPFVLSHGEEWGCDAVELNRDGTYSCRFGDYKTLADGWSYWLASDEHGDAIFYALNRETGEAQIVQAPGEGKKCKVSHRAMNPPRVLLSCDADPHMIIWSPERAASYRIREFSNRSWLSDDGLLFTAYYDDENVETVDSVARGWTDLLAISRTEIPLETKQDVASFSYHGNWLITSAHTRPRWFAAKEGQGIQKAVSSSLIFPNADVLDYSGDDLVMGHWRGGPNPTRVVGFSPEQDLIVKLPSADNRESIITATHILSTTQRHRELVAWRRGLIWPVSSDG